MVTRAELDELFRVVRHQLFPRWNRDGRWRAKIGYRSEETNEDGYCDTERLTIWVSPRLARDSDADALMALLVHEICHAIAGAGHEKRWQNRMTKAAQATSSDLERVGELLRDDVERYASTPTIQASVIYKNVEQCCVDDGLDLEQTIGALGRHYGLTRAEFLERYPHIGAVFAASRRLAALRIRYHRRD